MAADPVTAAAVDDLFNFDSTDDEGTTARKQTANQPRDDKTTLSPRAAKRKLPDLGDDTLGLDSEIKVKKARKPIAKLDEARLLSAPGLPKLRADVRSGKLWKKLRLKGKGHEFTDVAKLLSYYQLWLDDLYPRAKFADGLQLIEKAGHTRRMQTVRKEWIDEGKPGYIRDHEAKKKAKHDLEHNANDGPDGDDLFISGANGEHKTGAAEDEDDSLFISDPRVVENTKTEANELPEDDELDALLAEQNARTTAGRRTVLDDSEGEDDLDALLAEQETRRSDKHTTELLNAEASRPDNDEDMDDLDALLAEQETRSKPEHVQGAVPAGESEDQVMQAREEEDFLDEDDDLDALIMEQEQNNVNTKPASTIANEESKDQDGADMFSSSPIRGTGTPRRENAFDDAAVETIVPGRPGTPALPPPSASGPGNLESGEGGDKDAKAHIEDKDDQHQDAGDMFSSSPIRKD